MGLYLGSEKVKINFDEITYKTNFYSVIPSKILKSSDEYTLTDSDGNILMTKEEVNYG